MNVPFFILHYVSNYFILHYVSNYFILHYVSNYQRSQVNHLLRLQQAEQVLDFDARSLALSVVACQYPF